MNKIKKCVYNLAREYVKKQLTGNLGKVVEKEDRLICYVNKTKSTAETVLFIWTNLF